MNINQLARNQQMIYKIIKNNGGSASQMSMGLSGFNTLKNTGNGVSADSLMAQMGISGLKGRTVREMAKYQMETEGQAKATQQPGTDAGSLTTQFAARTQYTPISDEATKAMQDLALKNATNSIGNASSFDSKERATIIQEQLKDVAPSKRSAAFNTMNKVWESEIDRLGVYIKEKDSSWNNWGDSFDIDILKDYKPGVNVWT